MTARLAYQIIMSLSDDERELLFDMLEPHMEKFEIDDFLSETIVNKATKEQITQYLIKTVFSKHKKS